MRTNEIIKIINELCPEKIQEEWDNSGWQINLGKKEANNLLICLSLSKKGTGVAPFLIET